MTKVGKQEAAQQSLSAEPSGPIKQPASPKKRVAKKPSAKKPKTTRTKRDDFSATTVRLLRDMAGNVCSKPDCHVHTHGSKAGRDGAFTVGVACHIKAASPGGPRYDPEQTPAQRKSSDNGIWMCQTHSRLVDVDGLPYPVDILTEWKRLAELRANEMVNRRAFTQTEVSNAVNKGSVALLDRFVNRSENPIDSPIAEMLDGYETGLEGLDPRFKVEVNRMGGQLHHVITPQAGGATIQLLVKDITNIAGFREGERALFEEGRELVIPGPNFEFAGSKLFEAIHQKGRDQTGVVLTLGGFRKPLKTNLYARNSEGHEQLIESFTSHYVSGAVRTVIEGECLGGLLSMKTVVDHGRTKDKFDLTFNLEAWRGMDVLDLPLFGRLSKALPYLRNGHLVVEHEVDNDQSRFSTTGDEHAEEFTAQFYYILLFLDKARQIAGHCQGKVVLKDLDLNAEAFKTSGRYCRLLAGPVPGKRMVSKLGSGLFSFDDAGGYDEWLEGARGEHFLITPDKPVEFKLLGQMIRPPRIRTSYSSLDCILYCDLKDRETWLELHTDDKTQIEFSLCEEDPWQVVK
ncbi:hypothetical protein [Pseudomonas syringae]|uniref:hypothetical protein n=1 Tax=Pseudomonas syringae TaxID=317 RepID=UPI001BCAF246|nr:hypothetical protein [Pseudomonas syringae]QVI69406.1 hypothetical protein KHW12_19990 [Pseudomonas syringae]